MILILFLSNTIIKLFINNFLNYKLVYSMYMINLIISLQHKIKIINKF